jgi:hypothetical protein
MYVTYHSSGFQVSYKKKQWKEFSYISNNDQMTKYVTYFNKCVRSVVCFLHFSSMD